MNIDRGGPWGEMEKLKSAVIDKVIPRLLRPMESGGRFIKPSLVHGDLWCGNAAVNSETGCQLVYDPSSFYAHNECEESSFRRLQLVLLTNSRRAWKLATRAE